MPDKWPDIDDAVLNLQDELNAAATDTVQTVEPPPPPAVEIPETLLYPSSFLCGPAGTGKTYLSKEWAAGYQGTVLAATTGIASVNLGEGTTINALLKYFDTASLSDSYVSGRLAAILNKLYMTGLRRILCDEVSMMDAEQVTIISRAIDEVNGESYVIDEDTSRRLERDHSDPLCLTLVGDFAQLPPVKAPFAFESEEWARYAEHTHTLTKIWRQSDVDFIQAVQAARRGDADMVVDYFRSRLVTSNDADFPGTTILATNDAVARYNALRMDKLTTPIVVFQPTREGIPRSDWKQIPDLTTLKQGALVMILANLREYGSNRLTYANGDLGTIEELDSRLKVPYVRLHRNNKVVAVDHITRYNEVPLEPGDAKRLREEGNGHQIVGKMKRIGSVTYLPMRVAYSTTVHKSQGLSLDQVQVNTREGFFKSPGLLYVALSRARTVEGLRLIGSVDGLRERCTVHAKVKPWL